MKTPALVRLVLLMFSLLLLAGCSAESKRARALERADGFYKSGDQERARIEYQNVLQGDPDNLVANERLALIWLDRGSPIRAAGYLSKVKTVAPGNLELRLKLAQILLSLGGAAEARREATYVLERTSRFEEAFVLLTESIRNPDDFNAADQILQKVTDKSSVSYLIATANIAILRGDIATAKTHLQRAVARDPKSPEARMALASFYTAQGSPAEARAEFKQGADLSAPNGLARLKYATYLMQTGANGEATEYLKEMVRLAPNYLPSLRALAQISIAERKFEEAQTRIQDIFAKEPFDYEARILRARLHIGQGETKRGIEELEKIGREFPGIGAEKHQLGLAYLQENDIPNAIKALQEAAGRNPDNLEATVLLAQLNLRTNTPQPAAYAMAELLSRRPNFIQGYPVLVEAARAIGKVDLAAQLIARSLALSPKNPQLHFWLGVVKGQEQKLDESRQAFEKALELSPTYAAAEVELVALDLREKKPAEALVRTRKMVAQAPTSALAHFLEGRVLAAQKQWAPAEASVLKALELDPRQPGVYGLLADIYREQKDNPATAARVDALLARRPTDEFAVIVVAQFHGLKNDHARARDVYEGFLKTKPDAVVILNNLASLYDEKLAQPDRALEFARKARQIDPRSPVIADTLGWILYRKKQYEEAAPLLEDAAKGLPNMPEVQYHLGLVQQALGRKDAAIAALKAAVNAPANFAEKETAKRELDKLEGRN